MHIVPAVMPDHIRQSDASGTHTFSMSMQLSTANNGAEVAGYMKARSQHYCWDSRSVLMGSD